MHESCTLRHAVADDSPLNRVSVVMKYATSNHTFILQKFGTRLSKTSDHHWCVAIPYGVPFVSKSRVLVMFIKPATLLNIDQSFSKQEMY